MRCILSLGLLVLACGNTSRDRETSTSSAGAGGSSAAGAPSSGGAAGSGSGGMPGAGGSMGSAGSGDHVNDVVDKAGALCTEVRRCYPDLQTDPTQCTAPADNDNMVVWQDPTTQLTDEQIAEWEACLRASEDQDGLRAWSDCVNASEDETIACVAACPTSAQACAEAGNASRDLCTALEPSDMVAINMCVAAIIQ